MKRNPNERLSQRHSGFGVHFAGVVGELCFRKVHGGEVSQEIYTNGDQHAADIITNGMRVEVKSSLYSGPGPEIKFEIDELERMEWCSLVCVTLPDIGLVSPIYTKDEIVSNGYEHDYGYGKRWVYRPQNGGNGRGI